MLIGAQTGGRVAPLPEGESWNVIVDYETRRPLIANLDVVGKFHAEKVLTRKAGD